MDAGPERRREAGFSLVELLVTLAALGLAVWIVLRVVDRGTRIGASSLPPTGPEAVLETAMRALRRDVAAAGTGGLDAREAFRPVADNVAAASRAAVLTAQGERVDVRPGTDELGLRGVIRSPLVALAPAGGGAGGTFAERLRADPRAVTIRAPGAPALAALRARLKDTAAGGKTFFLVRDASGRWAVARVASPPGETGDGPLDLVLDFSDPDARSYGRRAPDAPPSLGEPVSGGVFDDLVWFVARGPEGQPPDFVRGTDPASLAFPHPYLAVGTAVGGDRWDVRRMGEDVENFQVAWGLRSPSGALVWRADAPGSAAPPPDDLADADGRPLLGALRLALVARAPLRIPRSSGAPPPEFEIPLNGPDPMAVPAAAPVGWDRVPQNRLRFDREARDEVVTPAALGRAAP